MSLSETCHGDVLLASTNLINDKHPELRMTRSPGCFRSKTESNLLVAIKNRRRLRDRDKGAVAIMRHNWQEQEQTNIKS